MRINAEHPTALPAAGLGPQASNESPGPAGMPPEPKGSRRRRVWELPDHVYCSVIGVCLPLHILRRLVAKLTGGEVVQGDYELHCGVIADCKRRTPLAELVQRDLDRRYAGALRQSSACKHGERLGRWWREAVARGEVAGAFWAVITHSRCDALVEEEVLHDIHMLQHQAGAGARAGLEQLAELKRHNAELARELLELRRRSTDQKTEHARRLEQLQATVLRLRAGLISRDTSIVALRERLKEIEGSTPAWKSQHEQVQESERQAARIHDLKQALQRARQDLARSQQRMEAAARAQPSASVLPGPVLNESPRLDDRAVLCVGGRQASVPVYRSLIEGTGGRFLHHDGGEDDGSARLDATLAAADLVICQTGCLSHDAYWRVKSHCKRTGKRCVFVDKPSATSLKRALDTLSAAQDGSPAPHSPGDARASS